MSLFKALFTMALAATAVMALPSIDSNGNLSTDTETTVCGNGQHLACCGTNGDGNQSLISGVNCLSIPILAIPIQKACGSNVAACCPHDSTSGAVAVGLHCDPIPL